MNDAIRQLEIMFEDDTLETLIDLARRGAVAGYWCPLCECTIGNGDLAHRFKEDEGLE